MTDRAMLNQKRIEMITPEKLAASGTEQAHQRAVFQWAALNMEKYPELRWMHHIPNGGSRGSTARERMIRGAAMKADGVKAGVADICLPVRRKMPEPSNSRVYGGLYIEMKKPGERVRKGSDQEKFREFIVSQDYVYAECDTWEKAVEFLTWYLNLKKDVYDEHNKGNE